MRVSHEYHLTSLSALFLTHRVAEILFIAQGKTNRFVLALNPLPLSVSHPPSFLNEKVLFTIVFQFYSFFKKIIGQEGCGELGT